MRMLVFSAAAITALSATSPAAAACNDDLIKADQNIHRTRAELQKAASAAAPAKCAAYRKHVASLTNVRNVFPNATPARLNRRTLRRQMRRSRNSRGK